MATVGELVAWLRSKRGPLTGGWPGPTERDLEIADALEAQSAEMERLRDQAAKSWATYKMMEDFIRAVASKKYDGEMYMTNPPKPVISYTAQRIVDALDAALQEAKDTGK